MPGKTVRAGLGLAASVLGAGMLISPSVVAGVGGRHALAAWVLHLVGGACFSCLIGLLAYTWTGAGSVAEVAGAVLGGWARQTVLVGYLVAFTIGQAAIATAAGAFASAAGESTAVPAAAVLLLTCTMLAATAVPFTARARRWRFALTAGGALVVALHPQLAAASGLLSPHAGEDLPMALLVLFFAGVGWEAMTRTAPTLAGAGQVVRAVAVGAVLVAGGYLTLALSMPADGSSGEMIPWIRAAGPVIAVVLGLYCVTNIRSAASFLTLLGGPRARLAACIVGLSSLGVLMIAATTGWTVGDLLIGTGFAVWAVYCVAMLAVTRLARAGHRFHAAGGWMMIGVLVALIVAVIVT